MIALTHACSVINRTCSPSPAPRPLHALAAVPCRRIIDWIRGGNPWAEQGLVPLSEAQGQREYVSSGSRAGASSIAAARLQRSDDRVASHRGARRGPQMNDYMR